MTADRLEWAVASGKISTRGPTIPGIAGERPIRSARFTAHWGEVRRAAQQDVFDVVE